MTVVEDAFATMVDQFKDPLAFLRELVQNALDAGSTTIDVDARKDGPAHVVLEVRDYGDGMDRAIIETRLTRLFASTKGEDKTKIGKFGVGFSSVFSIRPEAVVVDTARGGERWRVRFTPDGNWKLFVLDEPLEGTRVRVIKRLTPGHAVAGDADALIAAAKRTVSKWCRYADADIRFAGAPIAEPFGVPAPVVVRVPSSAPGDELVVGVGGPPLWGFYNKGLTLMEGDGAFEDQAWLVQRALSFRVRDGALEHTITRDNVIRDDAFERVMRALRDAADGPLLDAALATLERSDVDAATRDALFLALRQPFSSGLIKRPAARSKRKVFRDARGAGVAVATVSDGAGKRKVARVEHASALADALEKDGAVVVRALDGSAEATLLAQLGAPERSAHDDYIAIARAAEKEQWDAAPLLTSMRALLDAAGAGGDAIARRVGDVIVGRVDDARNKLTDVPAVIAIDPARPIPRQDATAAPTPATEKAAKQAAKQAAKERAKRNKRARDEGASGSAPGGAVLVVNLASPAMQRALALSAVDIWLASFLALRLALPQLHAADGDLALAALQKRSAT